MHTLALIAVFVMPAVLLCLSFRWIEESWLDALKSFLVFISVISVLVIFASCFIWGINKLETDEKAKSHLQQAEAQSK